MNWSTSPHGQPEGVASDGERLLFTAPPHPCGSYHGIIERPTLLIYIWSCNVITINHINVIQQLQMDWMKLSIDGIKMRKSETVNLASLWYSGREKD